MIITEICSLVDLLCRMMKLGSNRKTMGIGVGIREFSVDNKRVCVANYDQQLTTFILTIKIGFGFCKGDDNFGGQRRKELDDFTKSLGKQMNLVMKRMEETKKVRMRLRERKEEEEEERLQRKELQRKIQMERISKNKEWRERKRDASDICSVLGSESKGRFIQFNNSVEKGMSSSQVVEWVLRSWLRCCRCGEEMTGRIHQCHQAHPHCQHCHKQHKVVTSHIYLRLTSHTSRPAPSAPWP